MLKKFIDTLGGVTETALNATPLADKTAPKETAADSSEFAIKEKEMELELLRLRNKRKEEIRQTTLTETKIDKPNTPKKEGKKEQRPKQIPLTAKDKIHYPVYLVLPEDDTRHTRLIHFNIGTKTSYYFLEWNNRVYTRDEIKNFESKDKNQGLDGNLDRQSANIIFVDRYGNLEIGRLEFTEKAKTTIEETDNLKMENRTYERIHRGNKTKFGLRPLDVIFTIAMLGVVMMLLFWATFDGVTKVLSVEGGAAHDAWVTQHTPITINVTKNQSGIGQKLDHT